MNDTELLAAAKNAALTIAGIYEWIDRVEAAGGATSISGISVCHAMLKSLNKNRQRLNDLVVTPLRAAIEKHEAASEDET